MPVQHDGAGDQPGDHAAGHLQPLRPRPLPATRHDPHLQLLGSEKQEDEGESDTDLSVGVIGISRPSINWLS